MNDVRVRMYRQGLGDCFLLSIATEARTVHALIDFGVLLGTPDAATVMDEVAADIVEVTGGHLDVLVVTHEHWDHVSGFVQAAATLAALEIGEVWVAWTEDPDDQLATALRAGRRRAVRAVAAAEQRWRGVDDDRADRLGGLLAFFGGLGADGRPTTSTAMSWVTDRSAVRYLRPGEAFDALGVRVYVLGPPRDRALIRRSDPSTVASEVYELAADGGALGFSAALLGPETATTADLAPFDPSLALDETSARRHPLIGEVYEDEPQAWRRIDRDWLDTADDLALKLDSDTNNTSLVLALELGAGGPVLLFPGDAQVGNWLSWGALEWTTGTGRVHARDLLARTRLYKVGHHGSHNATLRAEGLELMPSDELVAMIPVDRVTAQKQRWNMPLPSLLHRLEEKTRGRILDAELGRPQRRPDALGEDEWATFLDRTDVAPRWVDYTLPW